MQDAFSLQAFSTDGRKESSVETAYITVVPENDQIPVVVNNTGIKVMLKIQRKVSRSSHQIY